MLEINYLTGIVRLMKVRIKRFDSSVPLPEYKTEGAAALDLYAREETTIPSRAIGYVPVNIALEIPNDAWVLLAARSSLHKKGLMPANGIGIGDSDFSGENDEYKAALLNFSDKEVVVEKGERITQMIILRRERVELEEVKSLSKKSRGGFGSTGKK